MTNDQLTILQNMPIFGGLKKRTLEYLLERSKVKSFAAGNLLFREGDHGDSVYVVKSGVVEVVKEFNSRAYSLARLTKGDCVGEMEFIDPSQRNASVVAIEDVQTIILPRKAIFDLYRHDLEQFTIIQMNLGREVSRRLREADDKLFKEHVKAERLQELVGHRHLFAKNDRRT